MLACRVFHYDYVCICGPAGAVSPGNIPASLPRKKLNNMDITFIKNRGTELENYLTVWGRGLGGGFLIKGRGVRLVFGHKMMLRMTADMFPFSVVLAYSA